MDCSTQKRHWRSVLMTWLTLVLSLEAQTIPISNDEDVISRLAAIEAELADLRTSSAAMPTEIIQPVWTPEPCPQDSPVPTSKKPDFPTVKLGGFFQADWGWFSQDANNIVTMGDIQDGADFRRARLSAQGDVFDNVGYMIEFDFAFPGRPSFMDVWLDIRDTPVGTVRFGQ